MTKIGTVGGELGLKKWSNSVSKLVFCEYLRNYNPYRREQKSKLVDNLKACKVGEHKKVVAPIVVATVKIGCPRLLIHNPWYLADHYEFDFTFFLSALPFNYHNRIVPTCNWVLRYENNRNDHDFVYPNVYMLTSSIAVASAENKFSKLKLNEKYLCSNMTQDGLLYFSSLSIEIAM